MRKCRFCEKEIQDASRVCEHCGKNLVAAPAPPRDPDYGKALPVTPDPDLSTAPVARVTVVDIDMKFGSMVWFIVKWTFASLPAFSIVGSLLAFLLFFFGPLIRACAAPR